MKWKNIVFIIVILILIIGVIIAQKTKESLNEINIIKSSIPCEYKTPYYTKQLLDTGSMRPIINDWSNVTLNRVTSPKNISIGSIVEIDTLKTNYQQVENETRKYRYLIHRIVEINSNGYITKGDNNDEIDSNAWNLSQIKGVVICVDGWEIR